MDIKVVLLLVELLAIRACVTASDSMVKTDKLQPKTTTQPIRPIVDESALNKSRGVIHLSPEQLQQEEHRGRTRRAVNLLLRNYRTGKLRAVGDGVSYHCFKTIETDVTGKRSVKRGCLAVPEDLSACSMLNKPDVTQEKCAICTADKCNSSMVLQVHHFLLLLATSYNLIVRTSGLL